MNKEPVFLMWLCTVDGLMPRFKTISDSLLCEHTYVQYFGGIPPGNNASAPGIQNVMWPRVWPGVSNTCKVRM